MEEIFQFIWYLIIGVSVVLYTVLDGFDLGVGCLHPFAKGDHQRRLMLNAIGPVWDGNEVWLIIVFGGMFVGFPPVYASICSAFYGLIMIFLHELIFYGLLQFKTDTSFTQLIYTRVFPNTVYTSVMLVLVNLFTHKYFRE